MKVNVHLRAIYNKTFYGQDHWQRTYLSLKRDMKIDAHKSMYKNAQKIDTNYQYYTVLCNIKY